ncbi:hypothetical protein [Facilibium subflavum]|uniref:hypothetical protein n=1 Tax=Facilibium subflavum TaxID=2219058 RepID=UPI000E64BB69|nr:hypothetical protein [Facilibium subflavum]
MHCLIANFGDDSVALIQWAYENKLDDVIVLSVDTGWQASIWQERLDIAHQWIQTLGFTHHHLPAEHDFSALVRARSQFPSQKFHWCAGFLKGITILNWLEENDEDGQAIIALANRRSMSKAQTDLPEYIKESERYDDRRLIYPLAGFDQDMRDALIAKTPFQTPLNHRSLECQPCIHFTRRDNKTLSEADITRIIALEKEIGQTMFDQGFKHFIETIEKNTNYYDEFAKTCSWDYGCGL